MNPRTPKNYKYI
jgi:hypothetical protein